MGENNNYTYKKAGVDTKKSSELTKKIAQIVKPTLHKNVLESIGGFSALYQMPDTPYKEPVLASSTDGVGTKVKIAIEYNKHEHIGIDLVAMCINDLITQGAKPLFFLDYFACHAIEPETAQTVLNSIAQGCLESEAALIGGETAEMSDMYQPQHYDLAGFAVGVVEKSKILSPNNTAPGDQLIAIPSSGFHANGYTLIRQIIKEKKINIHEPRPGASIPLLDELLRPTYIYHKMFQTLVQQNLILSAANITGGGIEENLPRAIHTKNTSAAVNLASWQMPPLFQWIQQWGNIETKEMHRTFNNGIGMILIVKPQHLTQTIKTCQTFFPQTWHLGALTEKQEKTIHYTHLP